MGFVTLATVYEAQQVWEERLEQGRRERISLMPLRFRMPKALVYLISLIF